MKILIDLTSLDDNYSGIERYAENVSKELVTNDDSVQYHLVFKNKIFNSFQDIVNNHNVTYSILRGKNKLFFTQIKFPLFLYKNRMDRYLFLAFPSPLFFVNNRSVSTIHDIGCYDVPETMTVKSRLLFKSLFLKSRYFEKKTITVSKFTKQRMIDKLGFKESNVIVAPCGISEQFTKEINDNQLTDIKKKYSLPDKYILSLSTLEPRKNLPLLIESYKNLQNKGQFNNVKLVLAGRKGWKLDAMLKVISKDIKNNIVITGFIDDKDLPLVYKGALFFVFPSIYEGFGIPPLESLAVGTNVLSSDAASMPEVLKNWVNYFKNSDINDFEEKLLQSLKGDFPLIDKNKVINTYQWKETSNIILNFIKHSSNKED